MSKYCADCPKLRAAVTPAWSTCRRERLCKIVDAALVLRYRGEALQDYQDRARAIQVAYARTLRDCQKGDAFPAQGHELVETAREVHLHIFRDGDPLIAGRFRERAATFGRHGHERYGSCPERIVADLRAFCPGYPPTSSATAGWWGARFLQRFFAIHPFVDGNGRTARLLLTWAIEESGDLRMREEFERGTEHRYVRALEHAHAHAPQEGRTDGHLEHYLRPLAVWVRSRVAEIREDEELEETLSELFDDFDLSDLDLDLDDE